MASALCAAVVGCAGEMPPGTPSGPKPIQFLPTPPLGDGSAADGGATSNDGGATSGDSGSDGGAAASSTLATIALTSDSSCTSSRLVHIDSVQVALYDGDTRRRERCVSVSDPGSLSAIVAKLPTPLWEGLSSGSYLLLVTGHDGHTCSTSDVVLCGGAKLTIPATGRPKIQPTCRDDTTPISSRSCRHSIP